MNIHPARILPLPRWVAIRIRDAVGAKMAVTFRGQAEALFERVIMATNHGNPSTNSDCGKSSLVPAARIEPGRVILPVAASALSISKTVAGKLAQSSAYVLRRSMAVHSLFTGQVLQNFAAHSSLLRSRYPARWVVIRQGFGRAWTVCRVGYSLFAVEVVKQSLCRLSQAFRLSLPGNPAESLDVYDVAYGDVPFTNSLVDLMQTKHRSDSRCQKFSSRTQKIDSRNGKLEMREPKWTLP